MTTDKIIIIIEKISAKIQEEKLFLTELDNVIGDGDHGINLARGFSEVEKKVSTMGDKNPGEVLKTVGMTLVSTVGGASGPLYGTGFMKMGMELKDTVDVTMEDFVRVFQVAIDGISQRGKSTTGEKTMLDSMVPAKTAMEEALAAGKSSKEAVACGVAAAKEGIEYTKTIAATKGRASYLGDRSIGHQDPGATSFTMMLEVLEGEL